MLKQNQTTQLFIFIYLFYIYIVFVIWFLTRIYKPGTNHHIHLKIEGMCNRGRWMWTGNRTEWSRLGYVEATRQVQNRNYWRQLMAFDPAVDGTR